MSFWLWREHEDWGDLQTRDKILEHYSVWTHENSNNKKNTPTLWFNFFVNQQESESRCFDWMTKSSWKVFRTRECSTSIGGHGHISLLIFSLLQIFPFGLEWKCTVKWPHVTSQDVFRSYLRTVINFLIFHSAEEVQFRKHNFFSHKKITESTFFFSIQSWLR